MRLSCAHAEVNFRGGVLMLGGRCRDLLDEVRLLIIQNPEALPLDIEEFRVRVVHGCQENSSKPLSFATIKSGIY